MKVIRSVKTALKDLKYLFLMSYICHKDR